MSFLSILKSIGHEVAVGASEAEKFSGVIAAVPKVGPAAVTILNAIEAIETLVGSGSGPAKKAAVTSVVNAVHPGIDPTTLSNSIDAVVSGLNAVDAALASIPAGLPPAPGVHASNA